MEVHFKVHGYTASWLQVRRLSSFILQLLECGDDTTLLCSSMVLAACCLMKQLQLRLLGSLRHALRKI